MKGSTGKLAAIGVLVLLIGLIAKFPARVAIQLAPEDVRVSGISGTIWSGRAGGVLVAGIYLRNVEWRARPVSLLTGKLGYSVTATPAIGFIESDLAVGVGGAIRFADLSAALPLSLLAQTISVPGLSGSASLRFSELLLVDGLPTSASGTLDIADMHIPGVYSDSLGGYRLEFSNLDDGVIASIEDTDGIVDIAGTVNLRSDRAYSLLAQLSAKPVTPSELARQIQFLPGGTAPGQHELRLEGSL